MLILAFTAWLLILKLCKKTSKNIIWIHIEIMTIQLTNACILYTPDDDPTIGVETCIVSNKWKQKCWHISVYFVVPSEILLYWTALIVYI
jgi:hypothetical protein